MTSYENRPVLVCTLGGKAQVVTFTIDALLEKKVDIGKVVVIHHAPPRKEDRLRQALAIIEQQVHDHYQNQFTFQSIRIQDPDKRSAITDLNDTAALSAVWETLSQTIVNLKKEHPEIHFCFTGGRRLLAMQAMAVLSLHATPEDHIWHLYTPDALREAASTNKILHVDSSKVSPPPHLIRVPLVPWAHFFKGLRALLSFNPEDAMKFSTLVLDEKEEERCWAVWSNLPPSLRNCLVWLTKRKSAQETADEMGIALGSVQGYMTTIRQECRNAWELDPKATVSFDWIVQRFSPHIDMLLQRSDKDYPKSL